MRAGDPADADAARRRLLQKSSFPHFPSFPLRTGNTSFNSLPLLPPDPDHPSDDITIDDAHLPHLNNDKDVYRWAILYENQRGSVNYPLSSPCLTTP